MNNLKQLQLGWILYAADEDDALPPNHENTNGGGQENWRSDPPSWVTGNGFLDTTSSNLRRGALFSCLNADNVYRCPSDKSTVRNRARIPRTRHYSMNTHMNGMGTSVPTWLPNAVIFRKSSHIQDPSPTKAFVFIDNHPKTMAGGTFIVFPLGSADQDRWSHFPDARHQNGANLSFADGHSEHWPWRDPHTLWLAKVTTWGGEHIIPFPRDRDRLRLRECVPSGRQR